MTEHERNRRLAEAAIETYREAKGMCGRHNPERYADCEAWLCLDMQCLDCPMEVVEPIGRVLKELGEEA